MRTWINLLKTSGPKTIIDVANHFLSIRDDDLGEDEVDETLAQEIVRREYISGSCAAYAVALHDETGYPIVSIDGGFHLAVRAPDGDIIDYDGKSPLESVLKRYGISNARIVEVTRRDALDYLLVDEEADDPWNDIKIAKWVLQQRTVRY